MRKLKLEPNDMQALIQKTIEQLQAGSKSITLNVASLLTMPTLLAPDKPEIRFSVEAYTKMQALVNYSDKEICWHGLVEKVDDLAYYIYDILVYPQIVTSATVEADEEEYVQWLDKLEDEQFNAIRMQGHSHVNMGTSPSSVDENYYEILRQHITDFYIYTIMNKSGKIWVNLYDMQNNQVFESNDLIITKDGVDYGAWYHDMYKTYVSTPKPISVAQTKKEKTKEYNLTDYYDRMAAYEKERSWHR